MASSNDDPYETLQGVGIEVEHAGAIGSKASIRFDLDVKRVLFMSETPRKAQKTTPTRRIGSPTSTESCILPSRVSHKVDLDNGKSVFVDLPTAAEVLAIPSWILDTLSKKAFLLDLVPIIGERRIFQRDRSFTGQAGLVLDDDGGNALLVTARHNVARDSKEQIVDMLTGLAFGPDQGNKIHELAFRLNFPQRKRDGSAWKLPLRKTLSWGQGWDMDVCPAQLHGEPPRWKFWRGKHLVDLQGTGVDKKLAFQKVEVGFNYKVGDPIAIVVSSVGAEGATPETASIVNWEGPDPPSQQLISNIFGEAGGYQIYIGEITHVGRNHIEHNINTYTGCSGAIIFHWDLEAWKKMDAGALLTPKALAVHVGYHKRLKKNVGLKLCNGSKLGLFEHMRQKFVSLKQRDTTSTGSTESTGANNGASKAKSSASDSVIGPSQTEDTIPGIESLTSKETVALNEA